MTYTLDQSLVARFGSLFAGATDYHGEATLRPEQRPEDGKRRVEHRTVKTPLTLERLAQHLAGEGPLAGSYPLVGDHVRFAALDVDDYRVDHVAVAHRVTKLGLPFVVTRSTSGGAHLYVFFSEPARAADVRTQLGVLAGGLGLAQKVEIFPKQDRLRPGEFGNYLALPYHNAIRPMRYAYGADGSPCPTFEAFLALAEARRVTPAAFLALQPPALDDPTDDLLRGAPPCLQTIRANGGLQDGTKKEGMFSVLVYLRKRFPDDLENQADRYNTAMCAGSPLKSKEMVELVRNIGKKDYGYKCKLPPLNAVCQRATCLRREFGIGGGGSTADDVCALPLTGLVKYQPADVPDAPQWGLQVDGVDLRVENDTLYHRDAFNRACLARLGRVPVRGTQKQWLELVDSLAATADVLLIPAEASLTGQVWEAVESYLAGAKATTVAQARLGGAYRGTDGFYFRAGDVLAFLSARGLRLPQADLYQLLCARGGGSRSVAPAPGRKELQFWWLPAGVVPAAEAGPAEPPPGPEAF